MTVYLIRHGKTPANEAHLYCGSTDLSLSERGAAELRSLSYPPLNAQFVTSGMKRANETLAILFGDVPYRVEPRFREVDFGIFEMQGYPELKDTPAYQAWLTGDNDANVPPEGESGVQMTRRVLEAFRELEEDTCVLTHGGVIAALMAALFPEEGKNRYEWQPPCGHGYAIADGHYRRIPEENI